MPNPPQPVSDLEADAPADLARSVAPPAQPSRPYARERYKLTTPSAGFSGERQGIQFRAGVGYTDDLEAVERCKTAGYVVSDMRPDEPHQCRRKCWRIDCPQFHGIALVRHRNVVFTDGVGTTEDKAAADFFRLGGCEVSDAQAPNPQFAPEPQPEPAPDRRWKISIPSDRRKNASFVHGGVIFTGGVGHTTDPAVADMFRKSNYCTVEEV